MTTEWEIGKAIGYNLLEIIAIIVVSISLFKFFRKKEEKVIEGETPTDERHL